MTGIFGCHAKVCPSRQHLALLDVEESTCHMIQYPLFGKTILVFQTKAIVDGKLSNQSPALHQQENFYKQASQSFFIPTSWQHQEYPPLRWR